MHRLRDGLLAWYVRAQTSDRSLWLLVVSTAVLSFSLTAHWRTGHNLDGQAAALPAWWFVRHGTFDLSQVDDLPLNPWYFQVGDSIVSNRTMGVILSGVPVAALLSWTSAPPEVVGTASAVLFTSAAVATLAVVVRQLVPLRLALSAVAVLAFGTAIWTTAAAELWTHGPNILWLSLALLALQRQRPLLLGLAMAPAVMTRPHLALVAAVLGTCLAWRRRSLSALLLAGLPPVGAVGAVLTWNKAMFGAYSLEGGYRYAMDRVTALPGSGSMLSAENVLGMLVSPQCGLLLFSPVVAVLAVPVLRRLRSLPAWTLEALVAAVAYQTAQLSLNRFMGGDNIYGNRLTIELTVLALPAAALAYSQWAATSPRARRLVRTASVVSVAIHAVG
ncbi:MAG TPA: hypothetical protein VNU66_13725, partial [Mycobacteriales bacterium]|nr:hypothetical protein [Mycobacteriales bacterium]